MEKKDKPSQEDSGSKHQTDLAEGELETVEESIREHERKGDLPREQKRPATPDDSGPVGK